MPDTIRRFNDAPAVARAAADAIIADARAAIAERGVFTLALSGGSTPKALYALLAKEHAGSLDWARVHLFFGDERCVAPDHPDSNFRMVREALLGVLPAAVHRIPGELGPRVAAEIYAGTLPGERPMFDVVLLGMGPDGHTASIFPGHRDQGVLVSPATAPDGFAIRDRVTLTFAALASSRRSLALVTGKDKTARLREVLDHRTRGEAGTPMTLARPEGVEFLVDDAAAGSTSSR
jgi:6-phosphogluconolactonase